MENKPQSPREKDEIHGITHLPEPLLLFLYKAAKRKRKSTKRKASVLHQGTRKLLLKGNGLLWGWLDAGLPARGAIRDGMVLACFDYF